MKTHRTIKTIDRAKIRTSNGRLTADTARRDRLKNSPLSPVPSRSDHPSISLRFEVRRPPAKSGQDASSETSSRFQAAYTVFRRRHPNSVPLTGQQVPPEDCSPLEYVEWAVWKARERWNDAAWDNWFLGFYEKLVKSDSLREVCQDQCKSPDAAYALLGLLLWDSDRFACDTTARKQVDERGGDNIRKEQAGEVLDQTSDPDAEPLLKIQELVNGLTCDYILEVNDTRTPATEPMGNYRRTLAEILQGFVTAVAEEADDRAKGSLDRSRQSTGRPEDGVTSRDMFCALVSQFVQEAFKGEDPIGQSISIIQDFAPGLLKDSRSSDSMKEGKVVAQRLKVLRKKSGAIKDFNKLVATYRTHRSFPSIMKTFQPE